MVAINSYITGGVKRAEYGIYDDAGFMCGAAGSLNPGEDCGMAVWRAMKSLDVTIPAKDRQDQTGDDSRQGFLTFESVENTTVGIQNGIDDLNHEAAFQGTKVYDDGQISLGLIDPRLEETPLIFLMTYSTAKKKVFGEAQTKGWAMNIFAQGEVEVNGRDSITERQLANFDFIYTAELVSRWPWGAPLSNANEGSEAAAGGKFGDTFPVTFHAVRGDDTLTAVTLDYNPIGTHLTAGAFVVWRYDASTGLWGLMTATTDYTVSGKTFTFAAALPEDDHVVIRYKKLKLND